MGQFFEIIMKKQSANDTVKRQMNMINTIITQCGSRSICATLCFISQITAFT